MWFFTAYVLPGTRINVSVIHVLILANTFQHRSVFLCLSFAVEEAALFLDSSVER